jgi:uncharacterized phage protein (TIGR02218 family)
MTFDVAEASVDSGAPVELYLFEQDLEQWAWTSADASFTHQSTEYFSYPISRPEISLEGRVGVDDLQVAVPRNNPVATKFRQLAPSRPVTLTLFRLHRDTPDDVRTIWRGRVRSVRWSGSQATLLCDLVSNALGQQGPRKLYQRLCPHMLYDHRCKVVPADHTVSGSVSNIGGNGTRITVPSAVAQEDGYWVPGYAKRGENDYRLIIAHEGPELTLMVPFEGLLPGETLQLFAGCNRSKAQCHERFSNVENFGGFPYIPTSDPFKNGVSGGSKTVSGDEGDNGDDDVTIIYRTT